MELFHVGRHHRQHVVPGYAERDALLGSAERQPLVEIALLGDGIQRIPEVPLRQLAHVHLYP